MKGSRNGGWVVLTSQPTRSPLEHKAGSPEVGPHGDRTGQASWTDPSPTKPLRTLDLKQQLTTSIMKKQ